MSLLVLLIALLAQHTYPPPARPPLTRLYGRLCLAIRQKFDAGDRNSGIFGWVLLMTAVLVPTVQDHKQRPAVQLAVRMGLPEEPGPHP